MLNIPGLYDHHQIEQIIKKYSEQKKKQIIKKWEFEQFYLKPQGGYRADILLEEDIAKRKLNIFEADENYSHLVITGEPGSGKTSSLLKLYNQKIKEIFDKKNIITEENLKGIIPLFIELNLYKPSDKEDNWIYNFIANDLNSIIQDVNIYEIVDYLLMKGKLLILLDGLNEVSVKDSAKAIREIKEFLLRYPYNKVIISAREQDYKGYFTIPVLNMQKLNAETVIKIIKAEFYYKFEKKINVDKFYERLDIRTKRLITNPMLLMMFLSIVKENTDKIPTNRGNLFGKFIEYWLEREERKAIERPESLEQIVRQHSLASIGFAMQIRGETRASTEIICEKLARNLIKLENERIIRKGKYGGVDILNDLKSMGFIRENYNMIKFFHPSFMEYFAAVELKNKNITETLRFSDEPNWEETMNFYYGLIKDSSFFIEYFLDQNRIFDAANCIIYSDPKKNELIKKGIVCLLEYVENKYEYYRKKAEEYLIKIDNPIIDSLLKKLCEEKQGKAELSLYKEISQKRNLLEFKVKSDTDKDKFIVSDKKTYYSAAPPPFSLEKFKKGKLKTANIEKFEEYLIKNTRPEIVDMLIKIIKSSSYDINNRCYAVYFLELTLKKWGIDILFETLTKKQIKKFISNIENLNETQIDKKYVFLNLLIDRRIDRNIRKKLCVNHTPDIKEEGIVFYILNFIDKNLYHKKIPLSDIYSLIIDCLYRIDESSAEEYLIFLLKKFQSDKNTKNKLTEILKDKVISEKNYKFFISSLENEKEPEIKQNIINAMSNTKNNQLLLPLLSLIKSEKELLTVKRDAIKAVGELGDTNILPVLKELSVDKNPEIYNSAFNALKKIERRNAFEESYMMKTDLQEVEIDEELNENSFSKEQKRFPKITLYKDTKEIIEIDNVVINLGPISGLIFYLIAVNTVSEKPINIDNIVLKLYKNGIYIDKERIKGRIADIRKKIKSKLGDKINPYFLIENVRKFGYRINATVKIN